MKMRRIGGSWLAQAHRRATRQPPPAPPPPRQRRRRGEPTAAPAERPLRDDGNGAVDMAGLIPDDVIVQNILSRLDLTSLVRAAAVSKPWRALTRLAPSPAAGVPWLLGSIRYDFPPNLLDLDCLAIHVPRPPSVWVIPPIFRYVGVVDGDAIITPEIPCNIALALYNPFSGEVRQLVPVDADSMPVYELPFKMVRFLPESGLVVAVRGSQQILYTYVLGQPGADWVSSHLKYVSDFIFYQDKLYCTGFDGSIYAFCVNDLLTHASHTRPKTVYQSTEYRLDHSFHYCLYHLVESGGDLLVFSLKFFISISVRRKHQFECGVRKVEFDQRGKVVSLVRVKDLGDRLLLVNLIGGSVSCSVPADPSGLFKKNCVYFIHRKSRGSMLSVAKLILIGEEKETVVVYPPQIPEFKDWPVWITPSISLIRS